MQSTRSYLYVEDVAEAFEVILRKGAVGETYNIGTQKERTVMDVAHSIAKHFSLPMDNIVHVRDRAFNDQRWGPALLSHPSVASREAMQRSCACWVYKKSGGAHHDAMMYPWRIPAVLGSCRRASHSQL